MCLKAFGISIFLGLCLALILPILASAQIEWSEPKWLTDSLLFMDVNTAMHGDTLHAVGGHSIKFYYIRSTDCGENFGRAATPASADTFESCSFPSINYSKGLISIVFKAKPRGQPREQVFHITSSDGGETWSSPRQVFNRGRNYGLMKYPRIAANGDSLFVSCRVADYDNSYLLSFRSLDGGLTWGDSAVADPLTWGLDQSHKMVFTQGRIHIVYPLQFEGADIFHTMSTDGGLSWTPRERLSTQDGWASLRPSAHADSSGNVIAAWFDYKYGSMCGVTGDILTRTSTDNGDSWLPEGRITYTQSGHQSACFISGNMAYATWDDNWPLGCSYPKIELAISGDRGQTWSTPELISDRRLFADRSSAVLVGASGDTVIIHCFWDRDADMGTDLYYVQGRYLSTGIDGQDGAGLPGGMSLTAYPNPFNSSTVISMSGMAEAAIVIYDITGRRIATLVAHDGRAVWNAGGLSSGVYFARVMGERGGAALRLVLLR